MVLYKRRGSRGFDSQVSFFSEDQYVRGGVAGSIPDELRKKINGTVQPVHLGYVHLLFHTFSAQLICLGYVHYLFNDISGGAIF